MSVRAVLAAGLLIAGITSSGCVHLPLDSDYAGPQPLPESIREAFTYESPEPFWNSTIIKERDEYIVRRIKFDAAVSLINSHKLVIDYYDLAGHDPTPAVLVLPILGGGNEIANYFAAHFARNGYAAIIVHRQESYKNVDQLEDLNRVFKQIVIDHMQALDWVQMQGDIDPGRIGVFGVSAGAIKGSLIYAIDKRIRAAVLGLGGGDVPHILAYSTEAGIERRRDKILERHGLTQAQLYQLLSADFVHDPLDYAPYMDARNVLMILAQFDTIVPFDNGVALRDAMGGPETIFIPTGHLTSVLYLPHMQDAALRFFQRKLGRGPTLPLVSTPPQPNAN